MKRESLVGFPDFCQPATVSQRFPKSVSLQTSCFQVLFSILIWLRMYKTATHSSQWSFSPIGEDFKTFSFGLPFGKSKQLGLKAGRMQPSKSFTERVISEVYVSSWVFYFLSCDFLIGWNLKKLHPN